LIIDQFTRTNLVLGSEGMHQLKNTTVAVFGLGGVGSYAAEALVRAGVGNMVIVDGDTVCISNVNRQLPALHSTIGKPKTEVVAARLLDINPSLQLTVHFDWFSETNYEIFFQQKIDYIIDAIDSVKAKTFLIETAVAKGIKIFSSMGTGNKLDASKLTVTDISKTNTCPLAKVIRKNLKASGIEHLTVVYSTELPKTPDFVAYTGCVKQDSCPTWNPESCLKKKRPPASVSFVPSVAGLLLAQLVVREVCGIV